MDGGGRVKQVARTEGRGEGSGHDLSCFHTPGWRESPWPLVDKGVFDRSFTDLEIDS